MAAAFRHQPLGEGCRRIGNCSWGAYLQPDLRELIYAHCVARALHFRLSAKTVDISTNGTANKQSCSTNGVYSKFITDF
jgi:hypothetical protein